MNSNMRKRVIALGMVCALSAGSYTAYADAVLVTDEAVVYASADKTSKVLGTLEAGALLDQVAEKGGWSKVELKGHVGYMPTASLAEVVEYSHKKTGYTSEASAMYKSFSTTSKKLGTIPKGEKVYVYATAGDWARVSFHKYTGFVLLSTLTTQKPEHPDLNLTVYACVDNAKVYNFKGKVVNTVPLNTAVIVHEVRDGLCLVEKDGIKAIMKKSQLSTDKTEIKAEDEVVEISPAAFYVKNDGAKVYNFKGKVIGHLKLNDAVTVDAYKGDLARVKQGKYVGVMYRSDLSSEKIQESKPDDGVVKIDPTTFYVQKDGAKVIDKDGNEITVLRLNTAVTVTAYNDNLAMVSSGFSVGFMKKSDLGTEKVPEKKPDDGVTEIEPATFYVQKDGAKVMDKDGYQITTLSLNTAVTVTAYNDDLAKVTSGSHVGFMKKSDLGPKKVEIEKDPSLQYGDKGEDVKHLQRRLRELGYFGGTIGGNYLNLTRSAVSAFQAAAKLPVTGDADKATLKALFSDDAPKFEPPKEEAGSSATPAHGTAKVMDWWDSGIQHIFPRGAVVTVTDVETGLSWHEKRSGGYNHADCQPLTAADTAVMKKAAGGHWSWDRRAIFVTINGVNYAASMNCMNHGSGSIKNNNFDGHHCIHFTNSRTHGSNRVCPLHQAAIKKAANATL